MGDDLSPCLQMCGRLRIGYALLHLAMAQWGRKQSKQSVSLEGSVFHNPMCQAVIKSSVSICACSSASNSFKACLCLRATERVFQRTASHVPGHAGTKRDKRCSQARNAVFPKPRKHPSYRIVPVVTQSVSRGEDTQEAWTETKLLFFCRSCVSLGANRTSGVDRSVSLCCYTHTN